MRLHRLELEGFGPFRTRQAVDLDAFAGDGIFLIAGRTGAGKSSVLDGICFALYGGVPRYDGAEKRLRSDHCAPDEATRVTVEFTAADRRWRVTRSPEYSRAKKRGSGTTVVGAEAQLDEFVDGRWVGHSSGPRNVGLALDEIVGLSQQQFLQVILLAQNRFAEFLLAKNDERQKLLRRLFGTRRYEDYQAAFDERRRDAERAVATAGGAVDLLLGEAERTLADARLAGDAAPTGGAAGESAAVVGADGGLGAEGAVSGGPAAAVPAGAPRGEVPGSQTARLEALEVGLQRADYRVETLVRERAEADAGHAAADAAHAAARGLRDAQVRRRRARDELAALESREKAVADDRRTLDRALAAEVLRAPIEISAVAAAGLRAREAALVDAIGDWRRVAPATAASSGLEHPVPQAVALREEVARLTGDIAVWRAAESAEREIEELDVQRERERRQEAAATAHLVRLDAEAAERPGMLADLDERLASARDAAGSLDAARARADDVAARLAAAREGERLAERSRTLDASYLQAAAVLDTARAAVTDLLRRRLAGHAGELAAALAPGEPCGVCGALEHPHPAAPTTDPVTDEQVAAAESARDAAARADSDAADAARTARAAVAEATARAGGDDTATLVRSTDEAAAALARAEAAAARRDALVIERASLVAADEAARADRERSAAEVAEHGAALAALDARIAAAARVVDAARGEHASVRARIDDADRRRMAAAALADAVDARDSAVAAAERAAGDLAERLAATDFADAGEAAAALCDLATRSGLDDGIRAHEVALANARDRLLELELALAGQPDDLVDLAVTEGALADARERWSRAVDAAAHAQQTATRARELVGRARDGHAAIADLAADHAVIVRLADTVAGRAPNTHRMALESFVLAAELEEIVDAANLRLDDMSAGRYRLLHTDALASRGAASGLGILVLDAHTGQPRPAQSLSGGETFLASLSLALGLAEVVTARAGGVRLDTLFIDEGFGSLDEDTLELAMRTLDELRQGGRTVGLISHVAAMREQIPAQLRVAATPQGPSVITQDALVST
ncbi:AAA family ATPase [Microbacterium hominis]|uniref:Nuclease SbcCD subunit C n=1 Tax=Microbacterium hominis TaxID=162426 RepID=A0A7D4U6L3_9MICO|nr:SMC family ATPase [Microbacterium hominis]QKJ18486.1 SMC family ATPase [Microbacterium hominis]